MENVKPRGGCEFRECFANNKYKCTILKPGEVYDEEAGEICPFYKNIRVKDFDFRTLITVYQYALKRWGEIYSEIIEMDEVISKGQEKRRTLKKELEDTECMMAKIEKEYKKKYEKDHDVIECHIGSGV